MTHRGARVSTVDLIGNGFVVLANAGGEAWSNAAQRLASDLRLDLKALTAGEDGLEDVEGQWAATYDLDGGGAVLVRPDGHVAWRARAITDDPQTSLRAALMQILCRP
jgi:hypothetical protein